MKLILMMILAASCSHTPKTAKHPGRIRVIKQWPVASKVNTLNIDVSSRLPEAKNQLQIYETLAGEDNLTVVTEGCEAGVKIDKNFPELINGWSYSNLASNTDKAQYKDILTLIALKLKVKNPGDVTAVCGDGTKLMQESLLALSNARAFVGFHHRLEQTKEDPKKFASYHSALEETERRKIPDPMKYAEQQATYNVALFLELISRRNDILIGTAKKYLKEEPVLLVSGPHLEDLEKKLIEQKIDYTIATPEGYPLESESLGDQLTKYIRQKK